MRFYSVLLLSLASLAAFQSCETDPSSSDSKSFVLTTLHDSTSVDVTGIWKLITLPKNDVKLALSSKNLQILKSSQLLFNSDFVGNRALVVKFDGLEHQRYLYDWILKDEAKTRVQIAVISQDTLLLGECNPVPIYDGIYGYFVREK